MQPETMKSKLKETIEHFCEKARSENMAPPYKISIINSEDHRELFATEATRNDEGTFSWTPNYPDFENCEHLKIELTGANGLVLTERLTFTEAAAPTKLREAGAAS